VSFGPWQCREGDVWNAGRLEATVVAWRESVKLKALVSAVRAGVTDRAVDRVVTCRGGWTVDEGVAIADDVQIDHGVDPVPTDGTGEVGGAQESKLLKVEEHHLDAMLDRFLEKCSRHVDQDRNRSRVVHHAMAQRAV
ncbi:uncharacterized protein METZ01_LOCUS13339, partial [marine metagenome]